MMTLFDYMAQKLPDPTASDPVLDTQSPLPFVPVVDYLLEIYPSSEFVQLVNLLNNIVDDDKWLQTFASKVLEMFPHLRVISDDIARDGMYLAERTYSILKSVDISDDIALENVLEMFTDEERQKFSPELLAEFVHKFVENDRQLSS